ncbi:MAG: hypothetical protein Q8O03_05355 [Nanoarchaeota archaeon]|nr:hypothetical protein [Nanoarchaeota archaeon]
MGGVFKKRIILTLMLFWFIPQVYVIMDCLSRGPCTYGYKFNVTFLILWGLLPSLFTDFFVILAFLLLLVISLSISFLISTLLIKK